MNWIIIVIVAVIAIALEIFFDNYVSDSFFKGREAPAQKCFFILPQILFAIIVFAIARLDLAITGLVMPFALTISGVIVSIANIFFYKALEIDDSTNVGISMQLLPVFYLISGWIFLGEKITLMQLIAFVIIISAPVLIIIFAHKKSRKIKLRATMFTLLYVAIVVIGNLIFVKFNSEKINYIIEIAFVFLGKGVGNAIIMLFSSKWRRRYHHVIKKSHKKAWVPLTGSFILSIASESAYRGALILAPTVALGSVAIDSTVPIAIFFMGILLTLIWPKFGREKLDKKSVVVHLVATILVVVGIILIQA